MKTLTLQVPSKIAADNTLFYYYFFIIIIILLLSFEENTSESSAEQDSHEISCLFSLKNNEKLFKTVVCCSPGTGCSKHR